MSIPEENWIPISALQHFSYCPRQCALIHVEQVFEENLFTQRGRAVHRLVDTPETRSEHGVRVVRALPLFSRGLGLTGKADVVEFGVDGTPYPVEYKHGPKREKLHDDLQLTAQALCLEDMTGKLVPEAAIFHHTSRRRREVQISAKLRKMVEDLLPQIRTMLASGQLPPPLNDAHCRNCSLLDVCQPEMITSVEKLERFREELFQAEDCV